MPIVIRVPLIGSGTPDDSFRADLPTHRLIEADYGRKLALVEIPDSELPDDPELRAHLGAVDKLDAPDQAPIPPTVARRWHAHLDTRYREHAGRFRPQRK